MSRILMRNIVANTTLKCFVHRTQGGGFCLGVKLGFLALQCRKHMVGVHCMWAVMPRTFENVTEFSLFI